MLWEERLTNCVHLDMDLQGFSRFGTSSPGSVQLFGKKYKSLLRIVSYVRI